MLDERNERRYAELLPPARIDEQCARLRPETVQRAKNDAGDPPVGHARRHDAEGKTGMDDERDAVKIVGIHTRVAAQTHGCVHPGDLCGRGLTVLRTVEHDRHSPELTRMDLRLCRQRVLGADHDHARVCTRDTAGELGIEHDAEAGEHGHVQPSLSQRGEETPVAAELKRERRLRIQPVILADLRNDRPQLICPGITDAQIRRRAERDFLALRCGVVVADHELLALPVEHLARRRQTHAALAAHEQRIAKLLLQQLDLLADCRLRDALLLGGTGEIEVLRSR